MPPRILLVIPDDWTRALLRNELIERGYNVVETPDLASALLTRRVEKDRGPVRAILIDQIALDDPTSRLLDVFATRYQNPGMLLLASTHSEAPPGPWQRVVSRTALISDIAAAIEGALAAGRWFSDF